VAERRRQGPTGRAIAWTLTFLLKGIATAIVIAVPVLGVWAGSSLAAYRNGPVWVAIATGIVMFPMLPIVWDAFAQWRRKQRGNGTAHVLTWWDRIVVRTFVLNFTFLAAFLLLAPTTIFTAVSTRGDWMLDALQGQSADAARDRVLSFADRMAWLYEASHENPYAETAEREPAPAPEPNERGEPVLRDDLGETGRAIAGAQPAPEAQPVPDAQPERPGGPPPWPMAATLHPVVRDIPAAHEADVATVARYIAEREPNPYLRIKALHDWVADRIAYDAPALAAETRPPQDADAVFRTRKAVCAGYAQLMVALGEAIGEEIVYVVGDARVGDSLTGESHAWNAVRIEEKWYLVDVTWDAGFVNGPRFEKSYRASNFLTPPAVFGVSHFPDDPEWQLREQPLSRGEFFRQPMMRPEFYAHGLSLLSPTRSQVDIDRQVEVLVDNPRSRFFLAKYRPRGFETSVFEQECTVHNGRRAKIVCDFARPGRWEVVLFEGPRQYGNYTSVGSIDVNSR
jgi:transglutaminase-like putative cysteine protease